MLKDWEKKLTFGEVLHLKSHGPKTLRGIEIMFEVGRIFPCRRCKEIEAKMRELGVL